MTCSTVQERGWSRSSIPPRGVGGRITSTPAWVFRVVGGEVIGENVKPLCWCGSLLMSAIFEGIPLEVGLQVRLGVPMMAKPRPPGSPGLEVEEAEDRAPCR